MASFDFDPKTGKARFFFRYGKRQLNKTLPVKNDREGERIAPDRRDDPGSGSGQADHAPRR